MKVYLNDFGLVTEKENSVYTAILSGSYRYSLLSLGYFYEVKSIVPVMPIREVFTKELLEENTTSHA